MVTPLSPTARAYLDGLPSAALYTLRRHAQAVEDEPLLSAVLMAEARRRVRDEVPTEPPRAP